MTVETELKKITAAKNGNKELAVFFDPTRSNPWQLELGNPNENVMLGEVEGELGVEGNSLQDVIDAMKVRLGI